MDKETEALVKRIQDQCMTKGHRGIAGLGILFRALDKDFSKSLNFTEFQTGMRRYGIDLHDTELRKVFGYFDKDDSKTVSFNEFLERLRPPMSPNRTAVINEAFDKLDVTKDGVLKVEDMEKLYTPDKIDHPKFRSGAWTKTDVLQSVLDTFDSQDNPDGMVTRDEFILYYAGVSSTIEDDCYFDLVMRKCWCLPDKKTK